MQPSPAVTNCVREHTMFCGVYRTAGLCRFPNTYSEAVWLPDSTIGLATEPGRLPKRSPGNHYERSFSENATVGILRLRRHRLGGSETLLASGRCEGYPLRSWPVAQHPRGRRHLGRRTASPFPG